MNWKKYEENTESVFSKICSKVKSGGEVSISEAWQESIQFQRPTGSVGYFASQGEDLLGVLPFYDILYVPITFRYRNENEFREWFSMDTFYFLDLVESGKIIPIFLPMSDSNFAIKKIWTYCESKQLKYLSFHQLATICVAFQSISKILLPTIKEVPFKDRGVTSAMIKASALNGRAIGDMPEDPRRRWKILGN